MLSAERGSINPRQKLERRGGIQPSVRIPAGEKNCFTIQLFFLHVNFERKEATGIQTNGCGNCATFTHQRADRDIFLSPLRPENE